MWSHKRSNISRRIRERPQNLTKKQKELLAEFEKLSSGETQPEAAGFFKMVKDFFGTRANTP